MWNKIQIIIFTTIIAVSIAFSWDGYDYDSGSYVEIDKGNLVRSGEEIEYYDYDSGEYKYADVESVSSFGSSVEIEVYNSDTDTYRTFEMDGYRSTYTPTYVPLISVPSTIPNNYYINLSKNNTLMKNKTIIPIEKFSLFIQKVPSNSKVRILNIKPKYYDGIKLKQGKYHIEVSQKGYKTINKWIFLKKNTNLNIELNQVQVHIPSKTIEYIKPIITHSVPKKISKKERENLNTCLKGYLVNSCKHSWLTPQQSQEVKRSERRENLNTCLKGYLVNSCKHSWLTPQQANEVKIEESRAN